MGHPDSKNVVSNDFWIGNNGGMLNRRTFLKAGAASLPLAAAIQALHPSAVSAETIADVATRGPAPKLIPLPARLAPVDPSTLPWQQKVRRVGQSNMTEHDPAVMNIEEWADYWHSAGTDVVFVSVTGILAFYPSNVRFHRHGKFLNSRDFFGECTAAAKEARHARRRADEPRPELARRARSPSRMGHALQRRIRPAQR